MSAGRFIGWVLVLAGLGLAARDAIAPWLDHTRFNPISFGAVVTWSRVVPLLQSTDRLFLRDVFEPTARLLETLWAFAVLLGLGFLVMLLDSVTGRKTRRR